MSTKGLNKYTLTGQTAFTVGDRFGGPVELFGAGDTVPAVVLSSVILWAVHFMILRGVKQSTFINAVVTVAKIIPIVVFVVVVAHAGGNGPVCRDRRWGGCRRLPAFDRRPHHLG
jgi:amino acid transporter